MLAKKGEKQMGKRKIKVILGVVIVGIALLLISYTGKSAANKQITWSDFQYNFFTGQQILDQIRSDKDIPFLVSNLSDQNVSYNVEKDKVIKTFTAFGKLETLEYTGEISANRDFGFGKISIGNINTIESVINPTGTFQTNLIVGENDKPIGVFVAQRR